MTPRPRRDSGNPPCRLSRSTAATGRPSTSRPTGRKAGCWREDRRTQERESGLVSPRVAAVSCLPSRPPDASSAGVQAPQSVRTSRQVRERMLRRIKVVLLKPPLVKCPARPARNHDLRFPVSLESGEKRPSRVSPPNPWGPGGDRTSRSRRHRGFSCCRPGSGCEPAPRATPWHNRATRSRRRSTTCDARRLRAALPDTPPSGCPTRRPKGRPPGSWGSGPTRCRLAIRRSRSGSPPPCGLRRTPSRCTTS